MTMALVVRHADILHRQRCVVPVVEVSGSNVDDRQRFRIDPLEDQPSLPDRAHLVKGIASERSEACHTSSRLMSV